jgi:hypothetical protein
MFLGHLNECSHHAFRKRLESVLLRVFEDLTFYPTVCNRAISFVTSLFIWAAVLHMTISGVFASSGNCQFYEKSLQNQF